MVEIRRVTGNSFPYQEFMAREDIPIHTAVVGVEDVTALPRAPWARTGGAGAFIELRGTFQSERGLYVGEVPPGGELRPEKHLYEKQVFILEGDGLTRVRCGPGEHLEFPWRTGSVFALPRNVEHRMVNTGPTPALYLAVTTAPRVINALDDLDLVFGCVHLAPVVDPDYFAPSAAFTTEGAYGQTVWHTNLIPDARSAEVHPLEQKVGGGTLTGYRMGARFPHGHISQWPEGRYHKAHYHGPGAVLLGLDGEGYVLAWDSALGAHPYATGHEDEVHCVQWRRNSIYSPPNAYYHQHFNAGAGPARHVAVYGAQSPLSVADLFTDRGFRGLLPAGEGGTMVEYEDEDPRIARDFADRLAARGLESLMSAPSGT